MLGGGRGGGRVGATSSGARSHFKREEHLQIRTTLRQGPCINYLHKWNFKMTDRLALVRNRANGGGGENNLEGSKVVLARGRKCVRVMGKRLFCETLP